MGKVGKLMLRKWEEKKMELDNEELEATKKMREKKTDVIEEFKTHCKRHIPIR